MINQGETKKPVLVALGIYFPGYSFTRVFDSLLKELSAYYTIHWSGIAYKGEVLVLEKYTLHPSNVKGGDIFGAYGAVALAQEVNADVVLLLNDFYLLKNYKMAWLPLKEIGIKLAAYVPMDGLVNEVNIIEQCLFLDELVLYHEAAKQDVEKAIKTYLIENQIDKSKSPNLSVRFHGVDTNTFKPLSSDEEIKVLRKRLFDVPDAEEAVFILNGNRHNERKDLESTIAGFALAFPHFKKPAYLVLHTPNLAEEKRVDLLNLIAKSGVQNNILLNPLGEEYVSDELLADLYRACPIGVNTSYGEGWGMISFEHAACGAAQIVPGHSAPGDLWKDVGVVIPNKHSIQLFTNPFLMYAVDVDILSEKLIDLVNDPNYLAQISQSCLLHARRQEFNWGEIAKEWYELLLLSSHR